MPFVPKAVHCALWPQAACADIAFLHPQWHLAKPPAVSGDHAHLALAGIYLMLRGAVLCGLLGSWCKPRLLGCDAPHAGWVSCPACWCVTHFMLGGFHVPRPVCVCVCVTQGGGLQAYPAGAALCTHAACAADPPLQGPHLRNRGGLHPAVRHPCPDGCGRLVGMLVAARHWAQKVVAGMQCAAIGCSGRGSPVRLCRMSRAGASCWCCVACSDAPAWPAGGRIQRPGRRSCAGCKRRAQRSLCWHPYTSSMCVLRVCLCADM